MFETLATFTALTPGALAFLLAAGFIAGLVRGFAGFALSAIIMASAAVVIPPVELIPVCFLMEGVASIAMFRGGWRDADLGVVWVLVIGSAIGVPLGLLATTSISVEGSQLAALCLILMLTLAQLFKMVPRAIGSRPGLYATGLGAGIATGLASVGGMVVALYVLSRQDDAARMRGSLVMFLFGGMFTTGVTLTLYGLLDGESLRRGLVLAPVVLLGVLLGTLLFRPSLVPFYRRFCLFLLCVLSVAGLVRLI
ncbi:sulfite exporter TauE/SafE family protein [Pontivivens insulae]|uniref:Probable membrane transporter protein n=1 Tax=Pontivivens insulae TaxID=1639689 RepID=A0A2R8AE39_9RHOB|nr:sulfite exporter TauE/SafE family protein [Pontivivens insulae]RED14365.1 hypothetical protein DFR53_1724 [Pontivivens insulae]SPF30442.1 hypothetical protein POI8812_02780 [Pontivivens insulae]